MSWAQCDKTLQETITFTDKGKSTSYSDLDGTLEKIKERRTLNQPQIKSFTFQKRLKKMLVHQRTNPADYKRKPQEKIK